MDFAGIALVTGAAGFIGQHLVAHLVALGSRVRATDLPSSHAVEYLARDYVVDNTSFKQTGYRLIHPDFETSMRQMGKWYRSAQAETAREEGKRCES